MYYTDEFSAASKSAINPIKSSESSMIFRVSRYLLSVSVCYNQCKCKVHFLWIKALLQHECFANHCTTKLATRGHTDTNNGTQNTYHTNYKRCNGNREFLGSIQTFVSKNT